MDAKDLGQQPAYPVATDSTDMATGNSHVWTILGGLTKREAFAKAALQGFIGHLAGPVKRNGETNVQAHARAAVQYADALLAELAKEQP